jgi:acyl-CoA synthetase (AMP-forming)/AMP-acid ligase II
LSHLERSGSRILDLYGMTEVGAVACCRLDDPFDVRTAAAARPLPGLELRVVADNQGDADGGEVQVRGPHVTPGYHRRPDETEHAFDGGWFRTGDLGTFTQGRLRIHGRAKDIVHVSGFNVFPAEVEAALLAHPDVAQACVVGFPDETTGEALQAFVVLRPDSKVTRANLLQFMRERIAGYKLPYALTILPEFPRLMSGKPDLLGLRRLSEAERSGRRGRRPEITVE